MGALQTAADRWRNFIRHNGIAAGSRQMAADLARWALVKDAKFVWGQLGEDAIIDGILGPRDRGFYVDVGSNHPTRFSNTFALYRRGWSGLCVDGNAALISLHRKSRPRDRAVCALVSPDREVTFTSFEDDLVSSVSPRHVAVWSQRRAVASEERRPGVRLDDLLTDCLVPLQFDLLTVDVEGHDLEVLTTVDLHRWRPDLIVVEAHDFDIRRPQAHPITQHLASYRYRLVAFAIANAYFTSCGPEAPTGVREPEMGSKGQLKPPAS